MRGPLGCARLLTFDLRAYDNSYVTRYISTCVTGYDRKGQEMAVAEAKTLRKKPSFTRDQIVNTTDIQRRWKSEIEDKLNELPYLVLLAGKNPRVVIMDYDKFEALWQKTEVLTEELLVLEAMNRVFSARLSSEKPIPLREAMERLGITQEEIDNMPDVELEPHEQHS